MTDLLRDLGESWIGEAGKVVLSVTVGGVAAWFARRPLEKAGVLEAVNKRLETYLGHVEAAHAACEARLDALEDERRRDRDEIDQLRGQVAQEKQIAGSIIRLAEKEA